MVLIAASCGDDGVQLQAATDEPPAVVPAVGLPPTQPGPEVAMPGEVSVVLTPLIEVVQPIALATNPRTGDVHLASKEGFVIEADLATGALGRQLLDIGDGLAGDFQEQGLLGIAWSPDGAFLYLNFTDADGDTVIAEYPATEDGLVDPDAGRELLRVPQPAVNHNGGHLAFGPDGLLYIAFGDGGGSDDAFDNGQDPDTLLGTIARIDPRAQGDAPYAVPADNPFVDGGGRPEIHLWGARNPWRFSFDRLTGDLWVADVGQDAVEELDVLYAADGLGVGANLGWPDVEGTLPFRADGPPAENYVGPIYEYAHPEGCSITGGHVYRGENIPELQGHYVFGDFCTSALWGFASSQAQGALGRFDLGVALPENTLVSFFEDADGELYVLGFDGVVYRLDPA